MTPIIIRLLGVLAASVLSVAAMAQARAAESIAPAEATSLSVTLNYATLIKVPAATTTLVIGNPAVADAAVQRNHMLVITGKSYGTTNILALDKDGKALRQIEVQVKGSPARTLTVLRGATDRETYSCTPRCEPTLTLGDGIKAFGDLRNQIGARNASAGAGAGGGGGH
jgi:hypothetical protein